MKGIMFTSVLVLMAIGLSACNMGEKISFSVHNMKNRSSTNSCAMFSWVKNLSGHHIESLRIVAHKGDNRLFAYVGDLAYHQKLPVAFDDTRRKPCFTADLKVDNFEVTQCKIGDLSLDECQDLISFVVYPEE